MMRNKYINPNASKIPGRIQVTYKNTYQYLDIILYDEINPGLNKFPFLKDLMTAFEAEFLLYCVRYPNLFGSSSGYTGYEYFFDHWKLGLELLRIFFTDFLGIAFYNQNHVKYSYLMAFLTAYSSHLTTLSTNANSVLSRTRVYGSLQSHSRNYIYLMNHVISEIIANLEYKSIYSFDTDIGILFNRIEGKLPVGRNYIKFSNDEFTKLRYYSIGSNNKIGINLANYIFETLDSDSNREKFIEYLNLSSGGTKRRGELIYILGRYRKVTKIDRKYTIIYKKERYTISEAKKLEKDLSASKKNRK